MRSYLISFLWALPFISFIFGYQILRFLDKKEVIYAPKVVGQNINDAIKALSSYKLNVRILAEKEDQDVPEGSIISQNPQEGQKVKSGQSIFLVITRKPAKPISLSFYGSSLEESKDLAGSKGISLKTYSLDSVAPTGTTIAQSILPDQEVLDSSLILYSSSGVNQQRILPDFKGLQVEEVKSFLEGYDIKMQIFHNSDTEEIHDCASCVISEQRPVPGTIVDLSKPFNIQVTI